MFDNTDFPLELRRKIAELNVDDATHYLDRVSCESGSSHRDRRAAELELEIAHYRLDRLTLESAAPVPRDTNDGYVVPEGMILVSESTYASLERDLEFANRTVNQWRARADRAERKLENIYAAASRDND